MKLRYSSLLFLMIMTGIWAKPGPVFRYNSTFTQELKMPNLAVKNSKLASSNQTIGLQWMDAKSVVDFLKPLYPNVVFSADTGSRTLGYSGENRDVKRIGTWIKSQDRPRAQIRVEIQVVEVNAEWMASHQNLLAQLTSDLAFGYDFDANKIHATMPLEFVLREWVTSGNAKVLARPTITTLSGVKSSVRVGDRVPYLVPIVREQYVAYDVKTVDTGIELEVLPRLVANRQLEIEVVSQVSGIKLWRVLQNGEYPVLSSRRAETKVILTADQSLVIAGLLDEHEKESKQGVPGLQDLPWIGDLFKSKIRQTERTDIVFIITPRLI